MGAADGGRANLGGAGDRRAPAPRQAGHVMMPEDAPLYSRDLPGGGYVEIEQSPDGAGGFRARLLVERRGDRARREGHAPPVIAEASGSEPLGPVAQLRAIAASNVAVAQRILRWQLRNR